MWARSSCSRRRSGWWAARYSPKTIRLSARRQTVEGRSVAATGQVAQGDPADLWLGERLEGLGQGG